MSRLDELLDFMKDNGGSATSSEIRAAGYSPSLIDSLLGKGAIERETRGVYALIDVPIDDLSIIAKRWKRTIFSYGTALYLLGLSDRIPIRIDITFSRGYNPQGLIDEYPQCRIHYVPKDLVDLGLIQVKTSTGFIVPVYNAERCLCDLLKARRKGKVDIQLFNSTINGYFKGDGHDLHKLSRYAEKLGVGDELRRYTEVFL